MLSADDMFNYSTVVLVMLHIMQTLVQESPPSCKAQEATLEGK